MRPRPGARDAPRRGLSFQSLLLYVVAAAALVSTSSVLMDLFASRRERTLVAAAAGAAASAEGGISLHAHTSSGGRDLSPGGEEPAAALADCRAQAQALSDQLSTALQELKRTKELADRLTAAAAVAQEGGVAAGAPPGERAAGRRVDEESEGGWAGGADAAPAVPAVAVAVAAPPQQQAPPPPPSSGRPAVPTLVIGIPSVARSGDEDYLLRTLGYIQEQTMGHTSPAAVEEQGADPGAALGPHPLRLRVLVVNNERGPGSKQHTAFEAAVAKYCPPAVCKSLTVGEHAVRTAASSESGGNPVFVFAVNGIPPVDDGADGGSPDVPGARVRRQTRDVTTMLDLATSLFGAVPYVPAPGAAAPVPVPAAVTPLLLPADAPASYFMFMEDDFRLCPRGLESLALLLARGDALAGAVAAGGGDAASSPLALPWNAIRVSLGLNGAILRSGDVPALSSYYKEHLTRRPPDHLLVEWFAGERPQSAATKAGRPHLAFKYNLLEHFGYTSSLRGKTSPRYALCYDALNEGVVFEVEAFKEWACGHDVLWPCLPAGHAEWKGLPSSDIDFPALVAAGKTDSVQTWGTKPPSQGGVTLGSTGLPTGGHGPTTVVVTPSMQKAGAPPAAPTVLLGPKAGQSKVIVNVRGNREALRLYRDILRAAKGFTMLHESGTTWGRVLAVSARKEFEAARGERDPELIARMIVVGNDALQQVVEKFRVAEAAVAHAMEQEAAGVPPKAPGGRRPLR